MIYFDSSATSLVKPIEVKTAVRDAINFYTANPGRSGHRLSIKVAEKIYNVREKVKSFMSAQNYDVIFTKNCTEAINLAIRGLLKSGDHVISTKYEHNSVLRTLEYMRSLGVEITIVYDDMDTLAVGIEKAIKSNTKLIITTHVSNVTGDVCDVMEIKKICDKYNVNYLVDGAQACGHFDINLDEFGVDLYAFAGHKGLLAITGVGGLIVKKDLKLNPVMFGGTGTDSSNLIQPNDTVEGFEAGTLPTVSIISLGAGVDYLSKNFQKIVKKEEKLSRYLYDSLKNLTFLRIYSKNNCSNIVSFNMLGLDSATLSNCLNQDFKICTRAGLHCAPLIHKSLGTGIIGAVRVSIDFTNKFEEIDYLVSCLKQINRTLNEVCK